MVVCNNGKNVEESTVRGQQQTKLRRFGLLLGAILPALLAVCMAAWLAACTAERTTGLAPEANPAAMLEGQAVAGSGQQAEEEAGDVGASQQSDQVADLPEQDNACLNCHSDKQRLIETAAPEQEVHEESSGEG